MKTAACIALLALAASACSKNDDTRTPADTTMSPGSEPGTQMPLETAAPNEITTPGAQTGMETGAGNSPGASGNGTSGNGATANGATGNGAAGATANGATGNGTSTHGAAGTTAYLPPADGAPSRPDADNTRVNQRDRGPSVTPMDQGNNETDLKITQQIRQKVMGDGALSFTAKNVKIITNKGTVVLRGPVKSDDERARIDAAAKTVAGDANVVNEIEIKK